MVETQIIEKIKKSSLWSNRRFLLLIIISIAWSIIIVAVSMKLYQSNGTSQLDLSRPGYVSVRSQAISDSSEFQNFPNSGPISLKDITDFTKLYDNQAQKIKTVDAFKGDPLSLESLGIVDAAASVE